jgi:uncharacterized membrane protein YphA (DoxX/SURF4 family)
MTKDWKSWAGLAARLAIGGIFTATALQKLWAPLEEFAALIDAYRIAPAGASLFLASALTWTQLVLGLCLLTGTFTRRMAAGTLGLLGVFIAALLSTVARGLPLTDCGCYGSWISLSPLQSAGGDVVLAALTLFALRHGNRLFSLDNWIRNAPQD